MKVWVHLSHLLKKSSQWIVAIWLVRNNTLQTYDHFNIVTDALQASLLSVTVWGLTPSSWVREMNTKDVIPDSCKTHWVSSTKCLFCFCYGNKLISVLQLRASNMLLSSYYLVKFFFLWLCVLLHLVLHPSQPHWGDFYLLVFIVTQHTEYYS